MKKFFKYTVITLVSLYIVICLLMYFLQESFIFLPDKTVKDFKYRFDGNFNEMNIKTEDGDTINALLFKADSSRGLIIFLHGNAGSLETWGGIAKTYTDLDYDIFIPDYRGFGKSGGRISSQEQMYSDVLLLYNEMKKTYSEDSIVVIGYSIGTAPASYLASVCSPRLLVLQAPYTNLKDLMERSFPFIPVFLLKYEFSNINNIKNCKMPVVIFHGNTDDVIPYESSLTLKKSFKNADTLITLNGQGHTGFTKNEEYIENLRKILTGDQIKQ